MTPGTVRPAKKGTERGRTEERNAPVPRIKGMFCEK